MHINIEIDDELMRTAMAVSGIRTKKGVVEQALREFVACRAKKDLRDLRGKIRFAEDYDYKALRRGK